MVSGFFKSYFQVFDLVYPNFNHLVFNSINIIFHFFLPQNFLFIIDFMNSKFSNFYLFSFVLSFKALNFLVSRIIIRNFLMELGAN